MTDVIKDAAMDPALSERAGEVLERLQKADEYEPLGHDGWDAADLITALLAQNAVLRAERDAAVALADSKFDPQVAQDMILDAVPHAKELVLATDAENRDLQTRLTAAEAERDALRALLDKTAATLKRVEDDRVQKIDQIAALTAREAALRSLASFVSGMDESTFFSFASDMDRAFETHRATEASGRILALIGGAKPAPDAREAALLAALQWCSGSDDFQEGGKAREGWLKLCAPLLHGETRT